MLSLNFYDRQVEFQDKLSELHNKQMKLENEFEELQVNNNPSSSERVLKLQAYHKKICEREKLAKERNQKILAEFEHVKKTLVSMERKSRSLKNAKDQCIERLERLYPEWRKEYKIKKAVKQLKENFDGNRLNMTYPQYESTPFKQLTSSFNNSKASEDPKVSSYHPTLPNIQFNAPSVPVSSSPSSVRPFTDPHPYQTNLPVIFNEGELTPPQRDVITLKHDVIAANNPTRFNNGAGDLKENEIKKIDEDEESEDVPTNSFFESSDDEEKKIAPPGGENTEPFTSPNESLETSNNRVIVIPGLKETTLESTFSDTATSMTSPNQDQHLASSSGYQALKEKMVEKGVTSFDDDVDDAEKLLSLNPISNNSKQVEDESVDEDESSSILSSEAVQPDDLKEPTENSNKLKDEAKLKRYKAPWESDSDLDDLDEDHSSNNLQKMNDEDFDFYD